MHLKGSGSIHNNPTVFCRFMDRSIQFGEDSTRDPKGHVGRPSLHLILCISAWPAPREALTPKCRRSSGLRPQLACRLAGLCTRPLALPPPWLAGLRPVLAPHAAGLCRAARGLPACGLRHLCTQPAGRPLARPPNTASLPPHVSLRPVSCLLWPAPPQHAVARPFARPPTTAWQAAPSPLRPVLPCLRPWLAGLLVSLSLASSRWARKSRDGACAAVPPRWWWRQQVGRTARAYGASKSDPPIHTSLMVSKRGPLGLFWWAGSATPIVT
ncbi:hypothetical protein PVAP13_2KG203386 [Panicum virgatum]|uniref:Uncharacterized protein n=1 Tax=Panicum virgatum TaxID=38727 RepID=A0A8T0WIN4_PANVG|nr:hypothetical protein PVAP13_2KG203386 [Panicum virgatum]